MLEINSIKREATSILSSKLSSILFNYFLLLFVAPISIIITYLFIPYNTFQLNAFILLFIFIMLSSWNMRLLFLFRLRDHVTPIRFIKDIFPKKNIFRILYISLLQLFIPLIPGILLSILSYFIFGFFDIYNNIIYFVSFLFGYSYFALLYSQTAFLYLDTNSLNDTKALFYSREIMMNYRFEYLKLIFSFLGWFLLSALFWPLLIWVLPYFQCATSVFYNQIIKNDYKNTNYQFDDKYINSYRQIFIYTFTIILFIIAFLTIYSNATYMNTIFLNKYISTLVYLCISSNIYLLYIFYNFNLSYFSYSFLSNTKLIIKHILILTIKFFIIMIGLLCFILPGVYLIRILSFTNYILLKNEHLSIVQIFKRSYTLSKNVKYDYIKMRHDNIYNILFTILTLGISILFTYPKTRFQVVELYKKSITYNK